MKWIFLSPHLDDAVFSCGGLICDLVDRGDSVAIWTICAGDPPKGALSSYAQSLHDRWSLGLEPVALRRKEDEAACAAVGAAFRHLDLMDCIYRRDPHTLGFLYEGDEGIFGELAEVEVEMLVPALAASWFSDLLENVNLVSPLALGHHVDHQLVRRIAEALGRPLYYYADAPYVFAWEATIPELLPEQVVEEVYPVSAVGMQAWLDGNAAYVSQISTFWGEREEMEATFRRYSVEFGGIRLWGKDA